MIPGDWRDMSVSRTMQQREVLRAAWDCETERPVMQWLLTALWVLIAVVLIALAYFTLTAASEPTARHPATTAHEAGVVATGGFDGSR